MPRSHSTELEPLVGAFEHLADRVRGGEALERLRRIASMVKPLMRQRAWRVGTLAEFYPAEHDLLGLNINRGEKVCLRLRYAGDDHQFLPLESVVDTMLHELAHNAVGPHNRDFHALWDRLRDEHAALVRQGYTGDGFLGRGSRLGGRRVPVAEIKRQARASAERRRAAAAAAAAASSGQKLGGTGIVRGQDARAVIAAAAEKRIKIERGCGVGSGNADRGRREAAVKRANVTRTAAEVEDEHEAALMQAYIELIQEDERARLGDGYQPPSQSNPAGTTPLEHQQHEIEQSIRQDSSNKKNSNNKQKDTTDDIQSWTCDICTLINPLQFLICDACGTERPGLYNVDSHSPSPSPPPSHASPSHSRPSHSHTSPSHSRPSHSRPSHNRNKPAAAPDRHSLDRARPKQKALDSIRKFEEQGAYKKKLPVGWQCRGCGNWMETEWWTCSVCGQMKASS